MEIIYSQFKATISNI